MNQPKYDYGIHCNDCEYEGNARTNSSTIFLIFFGLLCTSVFFLPLIIVALVYMGFAIARPAKKSCPNCKSENIIELDAKSAQTQTEEVINTGSNHT